MAQGKLKTKVQLPKGAQKQKHQKKSLGPKKGGRTIAPKKTKLVEANQLKKIMEKAINNRIEREVAQRAGNDSKPLKMVAVPASTSKDSKEKK